MTTFRITANGTEMGLYQGEQVPEALDAYARDAGYRSYTAMVLSLAGDDFDNEDSRQVAIDRIEEEVTIEVA